MNSVITTTQGPVGTIIFDRPKAYNAFNHEMRMDVAEAIKNFEADSEIRVVIIKGNGRGFSAGGDLDGFDYDPISDMINTEFKPMFEHIQTGKKLYIAQIHGSAAGIAAGLAMSCDFITMADDAFLYMAFAAIALVPDGGNTFHLVNAMGRRRALEAIVEGQRISAKQCYEYGIANKVTPKDQLDEATQDWAQKLSECAPLAVAGVKKLLRELPKRDFSDAMDAESLIQDEMVRSNDFKRGTAAFRAKEKPVFKGD